MEAVILVIHLFLALGIIGLVLVQRSEGGGLGIGGGGMGNLATPRATANLLTRLTAIFAGLFFLTSLVLGVLAGTHTSGRQSMIDALQEPAISVETTSEAQADEAAAPSTETTDQEPPSAPLPE